MQVRTDSQAVRVDAAVNCGNTLASWAELTDSSTGIQLLTTANEAYRGALQQEEDAIVSPQAMLLCLINQALCAAQLMTSSESSLCCSGHG